MLVFAFILFIIVLGILGSKAIREMPGEPIAQLENEVAPPIVVSEPGFAGYPLWVKSDSVVISSSHAYLRVPFQEKDEAKRLGARWEPKAKQWYVPSSSEIHLFKKWFPPAPQLTIELVPLTCWFSNVRSHVSREDWKRLQKMTFGSANHRCEICGGRRSEWPVECHEIWHYDDQNFVQTLKGLIALCPGCHQVKHMGLSRVRGREETATRHLASVNAWSMDEAKTYVGIQFSLWEFRSLHQWKLNLQWLEQHGIQIHQKTTDQPLGGVERAEMLE